jgi:hypothetical protein
MLASPTNNLQRLNCRQARKTKLKPVVGLIAPVRGIRGACTARVAAAPTDAAAAAAAAEDVSAEQQLLDLAAVPESSRAESASSSGRSAEEQTAALLSQIRAEVARRRNFAIISHPVSVLIVRREDCPRPANMPYPLYTCHNPACPHRSLIAQQRSVECCPCAATALRAEVHRLSASCSVVACHQQQRPQGCSLPQIYPIMQPLG